MKHNQKIFLRRWGNPLCMFFLSFLLFYFYTKHFIYWDVFISRDILRAQGWLKGQFYWPGPEMSGGTNLPGPLFYLLLFPSLIFGGENIYTQSLLWYMIWLALTYTVAFFFAAKIIKHKESLLLFLIAFVAAIGTSLFHPLNFGWNAGFSVLFHILALMGLYYWRETNKHLYLYLTGLVIALGIQTHFLLASHIITVLLFYFLKKEKRFFPIFLFIFLACFPVFLYNMMDIFETSTGRYINYLSHLKKYFFSKQWNANIRDMFSIRYTISLSFLFLFLTFYKRWKTKRWPVTKSTREFFIMIGIPCFIGLLSATYEWYMYFVPVFLILFFSKYCDDLMPDNSNKRLNYLLIFGLNYLFVFGSVTVFPRLMSGGYAIDPVSSNDLLLQVVESHHIILLFALLMFLVMLNIKWTYKSLIKAGGFFIFLLLIGQLKIIRGIWPWKPLTQESFSLTRPRYQHLSPLMEKIYLETNWPPREAIKRVHIIGIRPNVSLLSHYSMARETVRKKEQKYDKSLKKTHLNLKQFSERPQGYMIIQHLKQFINYSKEDWERHLSQSSLLSDFLRQEITDKKILIQTPKLYDFYWLISYRVTKKSVFVNGFGNKGQPYYWEEPEWLEKCPFTKQFQSKEEFYYCMVLPGYLQRAGIHIKFFKNAQIQTNPSHVHLDINFFGSLIGDSNGSTNLDGHVIWSDIQINLLCDGVHYKYNLPNIGNYWETIRKNPSLQGQNFTAPLKLQVPVKNFTRVSDKASSFHTFTCETESIKEIKLTFAHLHKKLYPGYDNQPSPKKINLVWKR